MKLVLTKNGEVQLRFGKSEYRRIVIGWHGFAKSNRQYEGGIFAMGGYFTDATQKGLRTQLVTVSEKLLKKLQGETIE